MKKLNFFKSLLAAATLMVLMLVSNGASAQLFVSNGIALERVEQKINDFKARPHAITHSKGKLHGLPSSMEIMRNVYYTQLLTELTASVEVGGKNIPSQQAYLNNRNALNAKYGLTNNSESVVNALHQEVLTLLTN